MAWSGTCSSCIDTSLNSLQSYKTIIRITTRGCEFKKCNMMHVTNDSVSCVALIWTMYEIPTRKISLWNAVYLSHTCAVADFVFCHGPTAPSRPGPPHYWGITITLRKVEESSGQVISPSRPTGIRSPDRPARRQSLYRLRYPAHTST